jgi:hypothetical protein
MQSTTRYKGIPFVIPLCWEMSDSHHGEQIPGLYEPAALGGHSRGEVQTFWFSEIRSFHLFLKGIYINIQLDHFHLLWAIQ